MGLVNVRYKGTSDVRIIEHNDPGLKARGIKLDHNLVWRRENLWKQTIDGMSPEMEQMFRDDGSFTLEAVGDDGTPAETIVTATRHDDTGAVVKDNTTGQVSKRK